MSTNNERLMALFSRNGFELTPAQIKSELNLNPAKAVFNARRKGFNILTIRSTQGVTYRFEVEA